MRARSTLAAAAVAATVLLPACALVRKPKPPEPPTLSEVITKPDHHEQLRRDLRGIFSERTVDHGLWSVAVHSLKRGETLYSVNSFRLQVPASNQKLLTTAVAAERLGWDYRYTTQLLATGPIAGGQLEGDLVVVANGDPSINPRHQLRWGAFDEWARRLAAGGLRVVNGRLIGDDNAFAEPGWGLGWAWDDFVFGYGAPVSALQYNENQVELTVGPGMAAGSRAIITVSPPGSGLIIDHHVVTVAAGGASRIAIERVPGTSVVTVRGEVAAGAAPVTTTAAVPNPTVFYLNAVRDALLRHGITIGDGLADIDEVHVPPDMAKATLLLEDRSASLFEIVDVTNKWSRNLYAETLLRSLSPPGSPATGEGGLVALT